MRVRFLMGLTLLLVPLAGARADLSFQFTDTSGNALPAYTFTGPTLTLNLYLVDTGTTVSDGGGLDAAGIQLNYSPGAVANVNSPNDITAGTGFIATTKAVTPTSATLQEVVSGAPINPDANNRVFLGTFTFTGLSAGSELVVTADPSSSADTFTDNGTVLDSMIANSSVAISVVPEPGPLVLTGLAVPLIGFIAWLRWRRGTALPA